MKKLFVLAFVLLTALVLTPSCGNNPAQPSQKHTKTPTATRTFTLDPSLGTATDTATPEPPTFTPTITETLICVSPLSFGKNFAGSSNSVFSQNAFLVKYDLPVDGKIIRLHAHVSAVPTPGTQIRMALYTDNAGNPGTLLSESGPQAAIVGWNTVEIPDTATQLAGSYWIAANTDSGVGYSYDTGASGDSQYTGIAFGSFPSTYGGGSAATWDFSFYADYCAQPGSDTPTKTPTWTLTPTITLSSTPTKTETALCSSNYSFGTNFPLESTGVFNATGYVFCNPVTLTAAGQVTKLHFYAGAAGGNVQMALYSDNAGAPDARIVQSGGQAAVSGVNNFDVPNTGILSPGVYWIALVPQTSVNLYNSYNSGNTGGFWGNGSYGSLPDPMTGNVQGYTFSFYADFCVSGGSPTPVPTVTWTPTSTDTKTPTVTPTETTAPNCQGNFT